MVEYYNLDTFISIDHCVNPKQSVSFCKGELGENSSVEKNTT